MLSEPENERRSLRRIVLDSRVGRGGAWHTFVMVLMMVMVMMAVMEKKRTWAYGTGGGLRATPVAAGVRMPDCIGVVSIAVSSNIPRRPRTGIV